MRTINEMTEQEQDQFEAILDAFTDVDQEAFGQLIRQLNPEQQQLCMTHLETLTHYDRADEDEDGRQWAAFCAEYYRICDEHNNQPNQ